MARSVTSTLVLLVLLTVVASLLLGKADAFVVVVAPGPARSGASSSSSSSSGSSSSSPRFAQTGGPSAAPGPPPPPPKPVLRVLGPDGKELKTFQAQAGANLRKTLQAQKLDVYDLMGKMTNCNGAGQCGTCAVKIESAAWGPRSEWEAGKLAKKYGAGNTAYHLACQTLVQPGEATITLRPPPPGKK